MHFLGRQVNVCAFYTELLYIPTITSPKKYSRCGRTMQTGKMHKMKRKNTQTNDIFNNIAELKKNSPTQTHISNALFIFLNLLYFQYISVEQNQKKHATFQHHSQFILHEWCIFCPSISVVDEAFPAINDTPIT